MHVLKKCCLFLLIIASIVCSFNDNIEVRSAGTIIDIKLIGQNGDQNIYWVNTNKKAYYICSMSLYLEVNDSLIEYWVNYKFAGVGNSRGRFFYPICKSD